MLENILKFVNSNVIATVNISTYYVLAISAVTAVAMGGYYLFKNRQRIKKLRKDVMDDLIAEVSGMEKRELY